MAILPTSRGAFCALLASSCLLAAPTTALADCADADLYPTAENLDRVSDAVVCLHNEARASRGLRDLRSDTKLRRAAARHADEMVEKSYFSHESLDGSDFVDRIVDVRYVGRRDQYSLGENLAWGTGDLSTPRGVFDAWMRSSGHRANLLKRAYRDIGVGIRLGVPKDAGVGATYTIDFGVKG